MASRRRRRFGVAHNPRRSHRARRVMRNAWYEKKSASRSVSFAPSHSKVAKKSWAGGARRKAHDAKYGKKSEAAPKAEKKAAPKSKAPRKPKAKASTRAARGGAKKGGKKAVKKNPSRRRRARRNSPRVMHRRRHAKRNASHRRHRRHVRRNPGMGGIILKSAAMAAGLYGVAYGTGYLLDNFINKPDAQGKTLLPDSMKEIAPALVTGGLTAALLWGIGKFGPPAIKAYKDPIMYGGIGATVLALLTNVTMTDSKTGAKKTLAQMIGLPFGSSAPAATAGYGVFGYTPVAGLGAPLAVEGVIQIPGGPLAVEGASFGGYLGTTLSNSVLGTQTKAIGPAPNPFAPGLREGNRGTWNEPTAAEFADSGSLSGNIFS